VGFPFGSYICVVDIDRGTGMVKIRRFVAVDACGNIINPMIVDGQIHGGLTMGMAPALLEEIGYDELADILEERRQRHSVRRKATRSSCSCGDRFIPKRSL